MIHDSPSNWFPPTLSDSSAVGAGSILVQHLMLIETNKYEQLFNSISPIFKAAWGFPLVCARCQTFDPSVPSYHCDALEAMFASIFPVLVYIFAVL